MHMWHSGVYEHFSMPPEVIYEDGVVKYRFWCMKYVPTRSYASDLC